MKLLCWCILSILVVFSLFLFVNGCEGLLINLLGDDWAVYWTWRGALICIDSYEDITDANGNFVANSITVRRFHPWPVKVPVQFGNHPVETNSEVPFPRGMNTGRVWVDKDNQPLDHHNESGHYYGPVDVTAMLQVRELSAWSLFFALTGAAPTAWVVYLCRLLKRRAKRLRHAEPTPLPTD